MPAYPRPPFKQWLDEEPSVVESPVEKGLRTAARWLGLGGLGPAEGPMSMEVGPIVSPLITIFKNKALREAATKAFRTGATEASQSMQIPALEEAAHRFADRYPRIAAHTRIVSGLDEPTTAYAARANVPTHGDALDRQVPIHLSPIGQKAMRDKVYGTANALDMMFHEGTHVAQALGNKDLMSLYHDANRLVGYNKNPFEISAYAAGKAAAEGLPRPRYPYNAVEELRNLAEGPWIREGPTGIKTSAQSDIKRTLHNRRQPVSYERRLPRLGPLTEPE